MAEKAQSVTAKVDLSHEHWCKRLKLANGDMLSESASTSGSDDEDPVGITENIAVLPTPPYTHDSSKVSRVDTAVTDHEGPIPIHMDDRAGSPSSTSVSGLRRHPLAENPNQSFYSKVRLRKDNARLDKLTAPVQTNDHKMVNTKAIAMAPRQKVQLLPVP
ncbi:uncharacterized protein EURHEDRAFT_404671 [Aspergillus ruber CBS 135680]|uniref:Uncharacterized protein n=1 Tax=Aspergillus ruber (strain CBS 135680) TaxID=1388766 RepID=A0A017S9H8_ASPRC|nr:uncharacterized protein EURHEDRAFT_404671 [Aspergillus ruber CBS 135680]EYE92850.1 hypothetical protein EURHEDRAFT_404671 [Aspergillus ruber CBS 135680]